MINFPNSNAQAYVLESDDIDRRLIMTRGRRERSCTVVEDAYLISEVPRPPAAQNARAMIASLPPG